jgi:hypothetical protein
MPRACTTGLDSKDRAAALNACYQPVGEDRSRARFECKKWTLLAARYASSTEFDMALPCPHSRTAQGKGLHPAAARRARRCPRSATKTIYLVACWSTCLGSYFGDGRVVWRFRVVRDHNHLMYCTEQYTRCASHCKFSWAHSEHDVAEIFNNFAAETRALDDVYSERTRRRMAEKRSRRENTKTASFRRSRLRASTRF